jgi:hypothetical protein
MERTMARHGTALNVGVVCIALALITLASERLAQASDCDVVTCSYVTKTVICHRIAHACPPQLLLPFHSLPQKQTMAPRPFPYLARCRHFRSYRLQSGRYRLVCVRSK